MLPHRFTIVFEKLAELQADESLQPGGSVVPVDPIPDLEEISELRRLVVEMTEPVTDSYTAT